MYKFLMWSQIALSLSLCSCRSLEKKLALPAVNLSSVPKNIIFMIVDGMGFEYIKAARIYNGQRPFSYELFPCKTRVNTCSVAGADAQGRCLKDSKDVTDSAAAAAAMATGIKVKNGVISKSIPHGDNDVETILERSKALHKSTGIVATKLFTDATPAAFVSHARDRLHMEEILHDMFKDSQPNVVFGADTPLHRSIGKESSARYQFVHSALDLKDLANKIARDPKCQGADCPHVYGGFGQYQNIPGKNDPEAGLPFEITPESKFVELGVPHLSEMTSAALKILHQNQNGFFLMIESSNPDMIGHQNDIIDRNEHMPSAIAVLVREMLEIDRTIKVLEAFVKANPDTLLILTADHETGGLVVEANRTDCLGREQCLPAGRWTSAKYDPKDSDSFARHTGVDVPLYAIGKGSELFCQEFIDNTDIPKMALGIKAPLTPIEHPF